MQKNWLAIYYKCHVHAKVLVLVCVGEWVGVWVNGCAGEWVGGWVGGTIDLPHCVRMCMYVCMYVYVIIVRKSRSQSTIFCTCLPVPSLIKLSMPLTCTYKYCTEFLSKDTVISLKGLYITMLINSMGRQIILNWSYLMIFMRVLVAVSVRWCKV